jgi:hypothetical protein
MFRRQPRFMNSFPFDMHRRQGQLNFSLALCRAAGAEKFKKQPLI